MNVKEKFKEYCEKVLNKAFQDIKSVKSYDDSTLFCSAGMQQYKSLFEDEGYVNTFANNQACLRINDLEDINDGTHLLYFNMLGLFSFREMTIKQAIKFWLEFLKELGLTVDYVTVHPEVITSPDWVDYYKELKIPIREDGTNRWSDGSISGLCTEFYINDVEVGNIVNPLETCIDCGFGLERLELILNNKTFNKKEVLLSTIGQLLDDGFKPSNKMQGYVTRKLMRNYLREYGNTGEFIEFNNELNLIEQATNNYNRLKLKHLDKSKEWWWETHGIIINDLIL